MDWISTAKGFDWDEGNRDKNWLKHKVSNRECEELFFNLPIIIADDNKHSQAEKQWYGLSKTNAGRQLFISFTVRNNLIRVISARDMSRKERVIYAKKTT